MSIPTFVASGPFVTGQAVTLGEAEAHHMRVRRIDAGAEVALVDGQGGRASGVVVRVARRNATVEVRAASLDPPPREVHLMVPVADKERMLMLAEKATELGASSWRPVSYRRSRSVGGRGEGPMFTRKVHARMTGALEQSGAAWLPVIHPDATVDRAIAAAPDGLRIVLDAGGCSLASVMARHVAAGAPVVLAVGPEGGLDADEAGQFTAARFTPASIGASILRFETAAIAALGVVQSFLHADPSDPPSSHRNQGA